MDDTFSLRIPVFTGVTNALSLLSLKSLIVPTPPAGNTKTLLCFTVFNYGAAQTVLRTCRAASRSALGYRVYHGVVLALSTYGIFIYGAAQTVRYAHLSRRRT